MAAERIAELAAELESARAELDQLFNVRNPGTAKLTGKQHGIRVDSHIVRCARLGERIRRLETEIQRAQTPPAVESPVDPESLKGARLVRTRHGWHEVVRVNRTSVTVKTAYSWTDRIPVGKILEAR